MFEAAGLMQLNAFVLTLSLTKMPDQYPTNLHQVIFGIVDYEWTRQLVKMVRRRLSEIKHLSKVHV